MSPIVIGLVLVAAATHATWNALLRSGTDRLWSVTVMSFATTLIAIPCAAVLPLPSSASLPYLVLSSCLQVGYSVLLAVAYRQGELGQVYPIVRGSVPLLVTIGGFLFAGQHLSAISITGVMLIGIGIMAMGFGRRQTDARPVLLAFLTGLFIAGYTTVDAIGVRHTDSAIGYATWIFLIHGILMPITFVVCGGTLRLKALRLPDTSKALAAGAMSLVAYGIVAWALAHAPAGPVSALREVSVVFATVIGRVFLDETLTAPRLVACAAVALGAVCISYQP